MGSFSTNMRSNYFRLTDSFQDPYFETSSLNDEYEKHKIGNSMKIPRRISYGPNERREQENYFATGIIPPWPIITQNRGMLAKLLLCLSPEVAL